jgi:hypothetical protein
MKNLQQSLKFWRANQVANNRLRRLAKKVSREAVAPAEARPVIVFNASARLTGLSQNAAFALLTGWSLRLAGTPVIHFACHAGLQPCVQGTNRQDPYSPPPCHTCIAQSRRLLSGAQVRWYDYTPDAQILEALEGLDVGQLCEFTTHLPGFEQAAPLGALVVPALRWALRRHTLPEQGQAGEETRYLLRQYILSAANVIRHFSKLLDETQPETVLIFNGIMYPEASARWAAQQRGLRVITHEVGFQRFSAFFSDGDATAYPIQIPPDFELSAAQNQLIDENLENRFQGKFSMAGIRFWPEMRRLDDAFLEKASHFQQIVPVFTNVVYDTSQIHANKVFVNMFAWLELVLELIRSHPETLFVLRAHPDEMRPGTAKQSLESVRAWVSQHKLDELANVVFIDSQEYISSYELIDRAAFVMVYNSSIGLEAALMGTAVLCAGKARYTQYPIVLFPQTIGGYRQQAEALLRGELPSSGEIAEFQSNARRFLYYQLYRCSLSFENFLEEAPRKGFVFLKPFEWTALLPENSPTLGVIVDGITGGAPFELAEPAKPAG